MTQTISADRNAFNAYNILYYPLFNDKSEPVVPVEQDYAMALTVQENLSDTPYTLSDAAVATLASMYAYVRAHGDADIVIDPASDIRAFCPNEPMGQPMYPDFPTQVIDMDENEFRAHQMTHYMSTYGLEFFASLLGLDISVKEGWLPDVVSTEKTRSDDKQIEDHVVDIVASPQIMADIVSRELSRPRRMSVPAVELACALFANGDISDISHIAFHENMMELIRIASNASAIELENVCSAAAQHPGDILKAVLWCADVAEQNHISTKAKKGFCRALDKFDSQDIAHNIADLSRKGERAINMLSLSRFAGDTLNEAVASVITGTVRSYNSMLESKWEDYKLGIDKDGSALLSWYGKRPGILLRSLARLLREGVDEDLLKNEVLVHVEDYSLATLMQLETVSSAYELRESKDWRGVSENAEDIARRKENMEINAKLASIVAQLIFERLSKAKLPFAGKKVFIDPCGFSLSGSVILPNEIGNTGGAYPPAGMAYEVPADKTVRFFTFWNDDSRRVDVDLHFQYTMTDGNYQTLGWNSNYCIHGMTTSGDITHSTNAAEYLDIDMAQAAQDGVDTVVQHQHIYCGASDWKDIKTCFSGAMVVDDTSADVKLYNSKNVLFHDDMKGDGRVMDYAMIDVPNHFVRILRGASVPFVRNAFTLDAYIGILLDAQQATVVNDKADADIVLCVGRCSSEESDGVPVVSIIDEGFFIN